MAAGIESMAKLTTKNPVGLVGANVESPDRTVAVGDAGADPSEDSDDGLKTRVIEVPIKRTARNAQRCLRDLPMKHARALADLRDGLIEEDHRLNSGKRITNTTDAICWIAERIER